MARQSILTPDRTPGNNGKPEDYGDAAEPIDMSEVPSFDPKELEAQAQTVVSERDTYDPAFLGLSQDFAATSGVKRKWDIIKVEKPSKSRVFRVHTDSKFRLKTVLLTLKEDNETYLLLPQLRPVLADSPLCGLFTLFACVSKNGTPFLWPVRMADPDGKWNIWHRSAHEIAEKAMQRWSRLEANKDAGHYVAYYDQRLPEHQQLPEWPELTFRDWLELAFKGFTIDNMEHPVLKRLRMED
jgi:hypothetical protein